MTSCPIQNSISLLLFLLLKLTPYISFHATFWLQSFKKKFTCLCLAVQQIKKLNDRGRLENEHLHLFSYWCILCILCGITYITI